jgi:choline kinase
VVLDNSKTISSLSAGPSELDLTTGKSSTKTGNSEAWAAFKNEILKLTHTLRLKGWRRVPLDAANEVNVDRLSGALTNAVYVVSPPHNLDELIEQRESKPGIEGASKRRKMPPKLLLRIYGPQVEHLIDREGELAILRRLARKKIGPRMLGTFTNGRFEEYFASTTLTTEDVRVPETSKQIARRMRELHEGMELLPKEIEDGAAVWRNWDKWVDRCEQVVSSLDEQVLSAEATDSATPVHSKLKDRGFICGVPWPEFRKSVETYRSWLDQKYGGRDGVGNKLVFAHNDVCYRPSFVN